MDDVNAPGPDSAFPRPSPVSNSGLFRRDPELAALLTRTEVAFLEYYQNGRLSQHRGQALLDMLRHPEFDPNDFRSTNIVHLLRRLERPYAEATLHTYSLWKEGDGNQKLDLVVRDYLEVFREVMRNTQWKLQFELSFRALFDELGNRLIGPPYTALWWERIQGKMSPGDAIGATQLYFDETFMDRTQGIGAGYLTSANLNAEARMQPGSIQLFALVPSYDVDAAGKHLTKAQIKERVMEVHQAGIGVIVRQLNLVSNFGQEVNVLCPDGNVYSMLVLMMCLIMDHDETERHCLKAANGCLSCRCSHDELADCSCDSRPPMLVEGVIREIEEAAAEYLDENGKIKAGCIGAVEEWEKKHKIKLYWNNWFDVSYPCLSLTFFGPFDLTPCVALVQYYILGERFQLFCSIPWCFMHQATIGLWGNHAVRSVVHKLESTVRNDRYAYGKTKEGKPKFIISNNMTEDIFKGLCERLEWFRSSHAGFQLTTKYTAHLRRVYLEGKSTFTAGRIEILMLALPFVLQGLLKKPFDVIKTAIRQQKVDKGSDGRFPDPPEDPCPDMVNAIAIFSDWYSMARMINLPLKQVPELQRRQQLFRNEYKRVFPEKSGEINGWNFPKFHGPEHKGGEVAGFGTSLFTDGSAFETAHKRNVKSMSGVNNRKHQFMCVCGFHERDALLLELKQAMSRESKRLLHDEDSDSSSDDDDDDLLTDDTTSRPCELAVRMPLWDMIFDLKALHREVSATGGNNGGLQRMVCTALSCTGGGRLSRNKFAYKWVTMLPSLKYLPAQLSNFVYEYLSRELGLDYVEEKDRDHNRVLDTFLVRDSDECDIITFGCLEIRSDHHRGTVRIRARPFPTDTFHGENPQVPAFVFAVLSFFCFAVLSAIYAGRCSRNSGKT